MGAQSTEDNLREPPADIRVRSRVGDRPDNIADGRAVIFEIPGETLPQPGELRRLVRSKQRRRAAEPAPRPCAGVPVASRLAIELIRAYQRWLSPRLLPRCVLEPSCSHYAALAVEHQGLVQGAVSTVRRLRRCRPANAGLTDYPKGVPVGLPDRQHRQGVHGQDA